VIVVDASVLVVALADEDRQAMAGAPVRTVVIRPPRLVNIVPG